MNRTLYKEESRRNIKLLVIFTAILFMYTSVIVYMFDPAMTELLKGMTDMMPEVMAMFGMQSIGTTLTSFMANYLYGFLYLAFPLAFEIMIAQRLVERHVERGSMVYLLSSSGNKRGRLALTQASVLISSIIVLIAVNTLVGVACAAIMFPGELDIAAYLMINLGCICLHLALSGLCFFASCISNDSRLFLSVGVSIPVIFYLIEMLANIGGRLENLKYFTIFTLFDTDLIMAGDSKSYIMMAVLLLLAVIFYILGIKCFEKRDLPI